VGSWKTLTARCDAYGSRLRYEPKDLTQHYEVYVSVVYLGFSPLQGIFHAFTIEGHVIAVHIDKSGFLGSLVTNRSLVPVGNGDWRESDERTRREQSIMVNRTVTSVY
jgi:hypothetical protein